MRTMEWAARRDHLGGIPRTMIIMAVGAFAKSVPNLFNTTTVYNVETLLRLVRYRPPASLFSLSAIICPRQSLSQVKEISIGMNDALDRLADGAWGNFNWHE